MSSADGTGRALRSAYVVAGGTAIIIVAAAILLTMGRHPSYANGPFKLWTSDASGPENSQQLADPYTLTHVIHGVLWYLLLRLLAPRLSLTTRGLLAVAAESGWEILENTDFVINRYREATLALGYYGDTVINSVGDILACIVGFVLAARLPTWATALFVVGIELVLLLWIRDSLALNLLMLAYPVEAVKRWQLGQ